MLKTGQQEESCRGYSDMLEQTGNIVLQRMTEKVQAMGPMQ